jgi:hypothetical protein
MRNARLKWGFVALALLAATNSAVAGAVTSFDDVTYWVGSGANRAAMAIDWDGASGADPSLVWGYQWDGAASGEDMFRAIVNADPRLFAKIESYGGGLGVAVYGFGYDDGDGQFALDDGTTFDTSGISQVLGGADGGLAIDSGDLYREGWFTGFWHYGVSTGNPYDGGTWSSSNWGMTSRVLLDGDWDSWAFDAGFTFTAFAENPQAATAVPEPSSLLLAGLGIVGWITARFKRAKQAISVAAVVGLAAFSLSSAEASSFATQVISYTPGVPVGVGSPAAYQTNGTQALGSPSHDTQFGSQVGVFYPAFGGSELVIVGAGGELTVGFDHPVMNDAGNPFGMDLLVFGNAFYVINAQKVASGIFAEPGNISVSQDGLNWFDVPKAFADTAFPTLGYTNTVYSGFDNKKGTILTDFTKPVDPSFNAMGLNEAAINAAYNGSGGGTGVDLAWVGLDWIQYVRVWQPAGQNWSTEIDGFADVAAVPEPGTIVLAVLGLVGVYVLRRKV